jgi:hypothetical protein
VCKGEVDVGNVHRSLCPQRPELSLVRLPAPNNADRQTLCDGSTKLSNRHLRVIHLVAGRSLILPLNLPSVSPSQPMLLSPDGS